MHGRGGGSGLHGFGGLILEEQEGEHKADGKAHGDLKRDAQERRGAVGVDQAQQAQNTHAGVSIPGDAGEDRHKAAGRGADTGKHKGVKVGQKDAVNSGFGDAEDSGHTGGEGHALELPVLTAQTNCQAGAEHSPAGNGSEGHDQGGVAGQQVEEGKRDDRTMDAKEDQHLPQAADQDAGQGWGDGDNGVQDQIDTDADKVGQGAYHQEGEGEGDDQGQERYHEALDHAWDVLVKKLVDGSGGGHAKDHRQEGAGIGGRDGMAEEIQGDALDGGITDSRTQNKAENGIDPHLPGHIIAHQKGHKVEEAVAGGTEQMINAAGIRKARNTQQDQDALDDAAGAHQIQRGPHGPHDHAQDLFQNALFLFRNDHIVAILAVHTQAGADLFKDAVDVLTDDHHVLPRGLDHGDHAVHAIQNVVLSLLLVFEDEAQAGNTVAQAHHVLLAAHRRQDIGGQFAVLF